MRILIDTCVILDALQAREPFAEDANNIFLAAANRLYNGYISAKATTDIYYLTHRLTHSDKDSRDILNKLLTIFDVLDTMGIDCRRAIPSKTTDYEDAVMIETAIRSEIDCIVTRNAADYNNSPVKIYTPSEFLKTLSDEN